MHANLTADQIGIYQTNKPFDMSKEVVKIQMLWLSH